MARLKRLSGVGAAGVAVMALETLQESPAQAVVVDERPFRERLRALRGKALSYSTPRDAITERGARAIREILRCKRLPVPPYDVGSTESDTKVGVEWTWVTTRGTFPKRLTAWLKAQGHAKVDKEHPDLKTLVGNLARQHSDKTRDYFFDFIDRVTWGRSQFGQSDSCWWNNNQKDAFVEGGGWAVRFYSEDESRSVAKGVGRAWVWPEDKYLVVFNGYWAGDGATLKIARVLAGYFGVSYRKIAVEAPGDDSSDGFYINGCLGYYVGADDVIERLPDSFDLPCERCSDDDDDYCNCTYCGERVADDDTYCTPDGESACRECFNEHVALCVRCFIDCYRRGMSTVFGDGHEQSCCPGCTSRYSFECAKCNDQISNNDRHPLDIDGMTVCQACAEDATECHLCQARTFNPDENFETNADGQLVCAACLAREAEDEAVGDDADKTRNEETEAIVASAEALAEAPAETESGVWASTDRSYCIRCQGYGCPYPVTSRIV